MRVLLIEDEFRLAENVSAALREGPGFAVDHAEDGEIGVELAENRCYDLIILDLMLPKLDGLSVIGTLRGKAAIASAAHAFEVFEEVSATPAPSKAKSVSRNSSPMPA